MYNIELEQALEVALKSVRAIEDTEKIPLEDSLGRILGEDFYAPMDNPPFNRSPLDGFAIRSKDTTMASEDNPIAFKVIDKAYAGIPSNKTLGSFQAIRIMTGGKMPLEADCVIRLEDCIENGNNMVLKKSLQPFENYCYKGEDIKSDTLLIEKGTKLSAIHLGVLGSMGQSSVKVIKRPKIGILVTGDEIIEYSSPLIDGKIYDTNGILLGSRLKELGFDYIKIDTEKDDPQSVAESILKNIDNLDILITTGGVSVGDKDIFHEVVKIINANQLFWKLKLKPGTPAMYSILRDKPILSLSGNPFASLVTFELIARPLLEKISRDSSVKTIRTKAKIMEDFNKTSKNRRFIRCIYEDGKVKLPKGGHSSGMLLTMKDCNAFVDIEAGNTGLRKFDEVEVVIL
ncbi:molybdopterin molybdotransferase MoeA [Wansuia hejianensis]|uniref:Molybdopterin molybdenumtransferase n=1 Tax=Wansuia hejianensis TaxID=2763667 RepID=A0A926F0B7_9FIRM|nr:molybdopterin molybdotransferase MoeA [Wansuia hejianensis]MBC8591006.1 molybdopterin molybdotransferase MoeA [Wansuia hejianensis]